MMLVFISFLLPGIELYFFFSSHFSSDYKNNNINNNDEGFTQSDSIICDTILIVITVNCMWYYIRSGNSFIIIAGQNFKAEMGSMKLEI